MGLKVAKGLAIGIGCLCLLGAASFSWRHFRKPDQKTYWLRDDILVHGNLELREVAFTFDDGPRPEIVRPLLNILGRYQARSTFFVVGNMVRENPGIVRRMMNEGHEVANHSNSHPRLDGMSESEIRTELAACDKAVFEATGARTNLFRPPGMRYDSTVIRAAQSLGYVTIHWKVAAQDFAKQAPNEIENKILRQIRPGSIVLLHSHPDTVAALPKILDALSKKGYRFVTVSQMLSRLPRPVFVKTNAYGATNPPPKVALQVNPLRIVRRKVSKQARPKFQPPAIQGVAKRGVDVVSDP